MQRLHRHKVKVSANAVIAAQNFFQLYQCLQHKGPSDNKILALQAYVRDAATYLIHLRHLTLLYSVFTCNRNVKWIWYGSQISKLYRSAWKKIKKIEPLISVICECVTNLKPVEKIVGTSKWECDYRKEIFCSWMKN